MKYALFFLFICITHVTCGMNFNIAPQFYLINTRNNQQIILPQKTALKIFQDNNYQLFSDRSQIRHNISNFDCKEYSSHDILQIVYINQLIENIEQEKDKDKIKDETIKTVRHFLSKLPYNEQNNFRKNINISPLIKKIVDSVDKIEQKQTEKIIKRVITNGEGLVLSAFVNNDNIFTTQILIDVQCAIIIDQNKIKYLTHEGLFQITQNINSEEEPKIELLYELNFSKKSDIKIATFSSYGQSVAYVDQSNNVVTLIKKNNVFTKALSKKIKNTKKEIENIKLAVTQNGKYVCLGGHDGVLQIYSEFNDPCTKQFDSPITALNIFKNSDDNIFLSDDNIFLFDVIVGFNDGSFILCKYNSNENKLYQKEKFHNEASRSAISCAYCVASPIGQYIISGSDNGDIILWDKLHGIPISRFRGHTKKITYIAIYPDGGSIISCSDGRCVLWPILAFGNIDKALEFFDDKERMQCKIDLACNFINNTVIHYKRSLGEIDYVYIKQVIFLNEQLDKFKNDKKKYQELSNNIANLYPECIIDTLYEIIEREIIDNDNTKPQYMQDIIPPFVDACVALATINPDFAPLTSEQIKERNTLAAKINTVKSTHDIQSVLDKISKNFPKFYEQYEVEMYNTLLAQRARAIYDWSIYKPWTWFARAFFKKVSSFINPFAWLSGKPAVKTVMQKVEEQDTRSWKSTLLQWILRKKKDE